MAVVGVLIGGVGHAAVLHLCPARLQIAVPELVAGAQGEGADLDGSALWTPESFPLTYEATGRRGLGRVTSISNGGMDHAVRAGVLTLQRMYTQ